MASRAICRAAPRVLSPDDLSGSAFGSARDEGAGNRFVGDFGAGAPCAVPAPASDSDSTANAAIAREREHVDRTFRFCALEAEVIRFRRGKRVSLCRWAWRRPSRLSGCGRGRLFRTSCARRSRGAWWDCRGGSLKVARRSRVLRRCRARLLRHDDGFGSGRDRRRGDWRCNGSRRVRRLALSRTKVDLQRPWYP